MDMVHTRDMTSTSTPAARPSYVFDGFHATVGQGRAVHFARQAVYADGSKLRAFTDCGAEGRSNMTRVYKTEAPITCKRCGA